MLNGVKNYKLTPYHENRFSQENGLLIEVILKEGLCDIKLYYKAVLSELRLNANNELAYRDDASGLVFSDGINCVINVYDAFSIETVGYEYNSKKYRAIEYVAIYANGIVLPAIKFHRKMNDNPELSFNYCWNS